MNSLSELLALSQTPEGRKQLCERIVELEEALKLALNACDCYEQMMGLLVAQLPVGGRDVSLDALLRVRSNVRHCSNTLQKPEPSPIVQLLNQLPD